MKILNLLLFIAIIKSANCQDSSHDNGNYYIMTTNQNAEKTNADGSLNSDIYEIILRDFLIILESQSDSVFVFTVAPFGENQTIENEKYVEAKTIQEIMVNDKKIHDVKYEQIYFKLKKTVFEKVCKVFSSRHSATIGIPSIAVKTRFGNNGTGENPRYFSFENDVNLGLSAGYKYSFGAKRQYAVNALVGFTISAISLDSLSTRGRINSKTSIASFSPHVGLVFDFDKFQAGLYLGYDLLSGELNKYWLYSQQPWLGIGLGYSIFNTEKSSAKNR